MYAKELEPPSAVRSHRILTQLSHVGQLRPASRNYRTLLVEESTIFTPPDYPLIISEGRV